MCLGSGGGGGGSTPKPEIPKPVPLPPIAAPPAPPRQAPKPREAVEEPNKTPDVVLGKKQKQKNRSSITSSAGKVGAPNIGTSSGTINI